jgi:hypothetical protein
MSLSSLKEVVSVCIFHYYFNLSVGLTCQSVGGHVCQLVLYAGVLCHYLQLFPCVRSFDFEDVTVSLTNMSRC